MDAGVAIPDFTRLQKQVAKLKVEIEVEKISGLVAVVVDSSGLKVFGDGERKVRHHGKDKRRT